MSLKTKFSDERLLKVLLAPVISEKATMLGDKRNQVVFRVMRDATKPEIQAAVEKLFNVSVMSVQTLNIKGKVKRFGRTIGRRDHAKKAYVCLAPGQEINFQDSVPGAGA
jgi:large subunit ribosomal protein L23